VLPTRYHCNKLFETAFYSLSIKPLPIIFKSPDLNPLDYHVGAILGCYTCQNRPTLPSWRLPCYRYGIICHRSSLIRQSCHFKRNFEVFDFVLLQLADTLNTQFKYRGGSWHSLLNVYSIHGEKLCKRWIVIKKYWICSMWLHAHLKKWTLKFKLLYLLNHMCYFNKICRICEMNLHLLTLQIWWI